MGDWWVLIYVAPPFYLISMIPLTRGLYRWKSEPALSLQLDQWTPQGACIQHTLFGIAGFTIGLLLEALTGSHGLAGTIGSLWALYHASRIRSFVKNARRPADLAAQLLAQHAADAAVRPIVTVGATAVFSFDHSIAYLSVTPPSATS